MDSQIDIEILELITTSMYGCKNKKELKEKVSNYAEMLKMISYEREFQLKFKYKDIRVKKGIRGVLLNMIKEFKELIK